MTVDYTDTIVGWVPDPANITSAKCYGLSPSGKTYQFTRYRIAYGRASPRPGIVDIIVDAGGNLQGAVGNEIANLVAFQQFGGVIKLQWTYSTIGQNATPTGFKVYKNGVEHARVAYRRGTRNDWLSTANPHGVAITYRVVTYKIISASDYENDGQSVIATPDAQGPLPIQSITAS